MVLMPFNTEAGVLDIRVTSLRPRTQTRLLPRHRKNVSKCENHNNSLRASVLLSEGHWFDSPGLHVSGQDTQPPNLRDCILLRSEFCCPTFLLLLTAPTFILLNGVTYPWLYTHDITRAAVWHTSNKGSSSTADFHTSSIRSWGFCWANCSSSDSQHSANKPQHD